MRSMTEGALERLGAHHVAQTWNPARPEMTDTPKPPPIDDDPPYVTDTFSRNDSEGRPGPDLEADEAALEAGEEGDYATDTFSRNDSEGAPGIPEAPGKP